MEQPSPKVTILTLESQEENEKNSELIIDPINIMGNQGGPKKENKQRYDKNFWIGFSFSTVSLTSALCFQELGDYHYDNYTKATSQDIIVNERKQTEDFDKYRDISYYTFGVSATYMLTNLILNWIF